MRMIDAHNHPDWHGHDLTRFLANMDQYGIDKCWLLSWECPQDEYDPIPYHKVMLHHGGYPIPFTTCLAYKQAAPERFVLGYTPDPRRPEAIDQLEAAIEIHGVQVCGELKLRMLFDNPDALRLYRFCGEKKLPVTVHIDYPIPTGRVYPRPDWWYGGSIDSFERAVQACPETIFIGHAPGFWGHLSGDDQAKTIVYPTGPVLPGGQTVAMFRQYPNLYADLSAGSALTALSRDRAFTTDFILEFQDRLLYGRDYFDNRLQDFLNGLGLPEAVLAKLYHENALRLAPE